MPRSAVHVLMVGLLPACASSLPGPDAVVLADPAERGLFLVPLDEQVPTGFLPHSWAEGVGTLPR